MEDVSVQVLPSTTHCHVFVGTERSREPTSGPGSLRTNLSHSRLSY